MVNTLSEIGKAWKDNPTRKEDYAYICRQHFDKTFEKSFEKDIMKTLGWVYNPIDYQGKGCISRMIIRKRTDIVKGWNDRGAKLHGGLCAVLRSVSVGCRRLTTADVTRGGHAPE